MNCPLFCSLEGLTNCVLFCDDNRYVKTNKIKALKRFVINVCDEYWKLDLLITVAHTEFD